MLSFNFKIECTENAFENLSHIYKRFAKGMEFFGTPNNFYVSFIEPKLTRGEIEKKISIYLA